MSARIYAVAATLICGTAVAPTRAVAQEVAAITTGVTGVVVDEATGEPQIEAEVKVIDGPPGVRPVVRTNYDGNFAIELPPGKYVVRVYAELHEPKRMEQVEVRQGETTHLDIKLATTGGVVAEEIVIEAKADLRTEAATLADRKASAVVSDAVSSQEMSRAPDSAASDAVKRVTGATVIGGRYVVLRGLSGRYTSTLMEGARIPTPEPDEPAVPLDLFPAALLANLTVAKTWSPELPGNFGGGALMITPQRWPTERELKLKLGSGFESHSTFGDRKMPGYEGGDTDFLGVDDGTRALPDAVPRNQPARRGGTDPLTPEALEAAGESFSEVWTVRREDVDPNLNFQASYGDEHTLDGHKLGYLASLQWSRRETYRQSKTAKLNRSDAEGLSVRETYDIETGNVAANLSGLVTLGWTPSQDHELTLLVFRTQSGDRIGILASTARSDNSSEPFEGSRIQWIERTISFGRLAGFHRIDALADLEVRWQASLALTARDEPDTRDFDVEILDDGRRRYRDTAGSGERFFSELDDTTYGAQVDLKLPARGLAVLAGGAAQRSERGFKARRFRFDWYGSDPSVLFLPPEELFGDAQIGTSVRIDERTSAADAYEAELDTLAGYAALDIDAVDRWRFVPGIRYEVNAQTLDPGSPFSVSQATLTNVDRSDENWLPSANVVYALTEEQNVRAGYSYTLARPLLREVSEFLYYDFSRRRNISGNPDLRETRIHNADLRWEWFLSGGGLLAASAFYKQFVDPIEQVVINSTSGDLGFDNADGADLYGGELEGRATLPLDFRVGANVALMQSEIRLTQEQQGVQTNRTRPLQGQSSWVVNAQFGVVEEKTETELTLLYNVAGRRITDVGIQGLPDSYEQPIHRVDASIGQGLGEGFALKIGLSNLLLQDQVVKQGDLEVLRVETGFGGSVSLEWKP
ncbi:MAG: TonB-dependent receptor domain-containing protein [Bradymonadia bacterium]